MAISAEHRSKFGALHRPWWRLHMSEKILEWDKNPKQTSNHRLLSLNGNIWVHQLSSSGEHWELFGVDTSPIP